MAVEARVAYLAIGLRPEVWRYCRRLDEAQAAALMGSSKTVVADILGVSRQVADNIRAMLAAVDYDKEYERLGRLDIAFVTKADHSYPSSLRDIYDPPATLFTRGVLDWEAPAAAIVGARRCTAYGQAIALDLAAALAQSGVTIISGMARGIDSAAHQGALQTGRTTAVMGCGLDIVYPPENRGLFERIAGSGGMVSEFPPGTPPRPINFPARNRIISGLSAAVVVVEAGRQSGALITADFALEQGKEVLVVPGSVRSPASAGCHELIKQGAAIAAGADDVLLAMGLSGGPAATAVAPGASAVLELIDFDKTHIDDILGRAERPPHEVLGDLSTLELSGFICRQAGGWYVRLK